jgi:hypothetical protein
VGPAFAYSAIALALSGCVFPGEPMKAGATREDFRRDATSCRAQALETAPRSDDAGTAPDPYVLTRQTRECLQTRGWSLPPGVVLPL